MVGTWPDQHARFGCLCYAMVQWYYSGSTRKLWANYKLANTLTHLSLVSFYGTSANSAEQDLVLPCLLTEYFFNLNETEFGLMGLIEYLR